MESRSASTVSKTRLLRVSDISKSFSGVQALDSVELKLAVGEVLAVIGENGAGKSTLMKILAGVLRADSGDIRLEGRRVEIRSVPDALGHGIALIHQELNLAPNLDVAANLLLGREPTSGFFVDRKAMRREARRYLELVGLDVDSRTLVGSLTIGQQQLVEIARALATDARILIMDEPTSSLTQTETHRLFEVIRQLQERQVSVVYISHRLGEVRSLADRVEVLRDGKNAGSLEPPDITHEQMVRLMVGRDVSLFYHQLERTPGKPALEVENLRTAGHPTHALNFRVKAGEMVGIAGLVGAGRTELVQTLFGVAPPVSGTLRVRGEAFRPRSPLEAIRRGLALVPEDRKQQALILDMAARINLSLVTLRRDQKKGFLDRRRESDVTRDMIARLRVKLTGPEQPVRYLSGGNQQKIVLGRWLAMQPHVLLLDEPTRGVDVGSKDEIYRILEQLAADGVAVVFVSSEMEEILGLADRVLVMHEGAIRGQLSGGSLTEEDVMQLATGGTTAGAA